MSAPPAVRLGEALWLDVLRAHRQPAPPQFFDILSLIWRNPGLQALAAYRFERWCSFTPKGGSQRLMARLLRPLARLASAFARSAYGIHLDQSADIAPGFYIGHLGGIVVRQCHIGPHRSISQQVKIGIDTVIPEMSTPTEIGSHVWIGAHARLCRGIRVGDAATIGAGSWVTCNVPARSLVLGNPGRIAQRNYDNGEML